MDYSQIAKESRLKCLELVFEAQTSHIGSLMSCADIFAVLFGRIDLDKDKFILSAGWKAAMLYYHLWRKGRITEEELNSYCKEGSKFIGLSEPIHKDIIFAGGSMGMGFPAAVGFALAKKLKGEEGTIYCLMSDGEMQIGTTWESALIASQHQLNNLVVIIDANSFQAMGKVEETLKIEPLQEKWGAFGWASFEVDGHDVEQFNLALGFEMNKPLVIIARTIKGKGVSFFEGNNYWHYRNIDTESYELARQELR